MQQAGELAKNTSILMNVSEFDDVNKATDALISSLQAFKKEGQDVGTFSMEIIDKYNEVGNNYAISTSDLAESLTRSSAALVAANNSLEESIAMTTAANTTIQDPESVGNALKVVSMRIRGVKTELAEAGEETEGMAENTAKLQEKIMALTNIDGKGGIDILTNTGEFKSTYDILLAISKVWKEMDDASQAALLELVAGKTRGSVVAALFQNGDVLEKAYESASSASGSAMNELNTYLDSIQGRIDLFNNSVQTMWMNFIDSEVVKFIVDLGTGLIKLLDTIGIIPTALAGITVYWTAIKKNNPVTIFKDLSTSMYNYGVALKQLEAMKAVAGNVDTMTMEQYKAGPINAYAAAVQNLTTKQQAAALASAGLTQAQIQETMAKNGAEVANIQQAISEANITAAKTTTTTATVAEVFALKQEEMAKLSAAATTWLLANSHKQLTLELVQEAVQHGVITPAVGAEVIAKYNLAAANNTASLSFKGLGASIKAMMASNPIGWIMMLISGIVMLTTSIEQSREEATRAADEAVSKYKEAQKTLNDQKQTVDELSASYKTLSKGVNFSTNKNINLTTESYEEYLDVCNKIADIFPELVSGYDSQGNAILNLKGNVDKLTQAYKDAAQAKRDEIIASSQDIWSNFKSGMYGGFNTNGLAAERHALEQMLNAVANEDKETVEYLSKNFNTVFYPIIGVNNASYDTVIDNLELIQGKYRQVVNTLNTESAKVKPIISALLYSNSDYNKLSDDAKNIVTGIINNLDAEFINSFDSIAALYDHIKTNIVDAFKDPSVIEAVNNLTNLQTKFIDGDIEYNQYKTQLNDYLGELQSKVDKDTLLKIKVAVGIDEKPLEVDINHIKTLLNSNINDIDNKIDSLSVEEIQIAGELEVPEGTLLSWEELIKKIEEAKIAATEDFDITKYTKEISSHSAVISEFQEAIQKLDKGSFTMNDFMELIEKYPDLAKGVDISSNSFYGLSRNLNRAIKSNTKSFIKDLKELRVSLVAAGKSTGSIDQLIDAIENMPSDALDDTIEKYSTLADEIGRAKLSQDRLLSSMEENPNEGYENRGEAMEYMKDALANGEIGSESNLWNVAERYGFTYDSAKTINENADALAQFIAIREKWFKKSDDGDDRTDDGYSHEGAINFIEAVENAVGESERLAEILTWDYNETTGELKFDFDNKDLPEIISLLSQTKELVGLTEQEWMDLMVQVGQYFGINWGDYKDAKDHLDEIANGTSDAKTKVEEYGKAMQDYFGKETSIDLTKRPMVSKEAMQEAGWDEFDGDYATLFSGGYSNADDTVAVTVTPILPDGEVLDPGALEKYANKLAEGTDPAELKFEFKGKEYTGEDIFLKKTVGKNASQIDGDYGLKLSEAQAQYDKLRDTLNIEATINESGLAGLEKIQELQNAIDKNSDGTVVINEEAFRTALTNAEYTEDQIDRLIKKIKEVNDESFNIDNFKIDEELGNNGIEALKNVQELQGAIKEDANTGITIFDTDMFASVLRDAGYTETKIDELIKKIQEYDNVVSVAGNTDPLGLDYINNKLGNTQVDIDTLKASLSTLGISYQEGWGDWWDGKDDIQIEVTDLVTVLKEKGWTSEAIKAYIDALNNSENEGYTITVNGIENIDAVIEAADKVPEEEATKYDVTGTGTDTLDSIENKWANITQDKTTNYTVNENRVIKTTVDTNGTNAPSSSGRGSSGYIGSVQANGAARADGSFGVSKTETSLVGELGPELLVRNGRWTTIGDNGAEFTQIKKGDIIFNHKQTEELLKNGYVAGRGKLQGGDSAFAGGTAFASGGSTFNRYEFSGNGGYTKYDVNDNVVDRFGDVTSSLGDAADSISDAADEFEEVFDWVEVRLEEIDETLGLLEATLENAIYYTEKNDIIDEMIDVNNNKLANLKAGYQEYADYAAELLTEVPEEYRAAAQNGAIAIEEFVGEADEVTLEAIENYREWAEKAADLNQQIEEVITTIRDLAIQKFDNAYEAGDVQATVEDSQTEKLQNAVDYDEERGLITSDAYYLAMMENSNKKIEYLTNARNAMQEELNAAVEAGQIERGSNEWYELIDQMYQVQSQIDESTIELEEFQNAINDIYWDNFDQLINRLDYLKDETQSLIDLMDNDDLLVDPQKTKYEGGTVEYWTANDVEWTDEGLASLGLYAQQMEIAEYTARQYAEAIDDLEEDYQAGLYSENEYTEKLNELKDAQYENIEAYYDAQDAIVELNEARIDSIKEGIEKEIEAYEELIEKQKEQLDAEKDLYDFQKTTADQQKNIANIERQLAALANDNSLSAAARRKQLEQELAEAQYELQDTYYNRSVEDKQTALDQELEKFQEEKDAEIVRWEEYLTNVELVVADSLGIIQANASGIYDTLMDKAEEYDLTISDAIMTPWQDGAIAVSDYQDNFDTAISSTMDKLEALKNKWQEVIDRMAEVGQANVEAFNAENANYAAATKTEPATTNNSNTSTNNQTQTTEKAITVGGKINASGAKIYSSIGGKGYSQYYGKDPIYTVLATKGDWIKVRHHKLKSGVTGWFKKGSVKAYAKGTLETKKDELAWIDELGEELQLVPGNNGRLEYVKKGTGIVPADLTERLMDLAMNPQEMLDRNRPQIAPSSSIVNTEIKLDCSVGTLVNIEHCDQSTLPDVEKIVNKAFDKHMQNLNNSLKRFTR